MLDCGTQGKPSTAFVAKTKNGPRIFSAAHNLRMAKDDDRYCKLGKLILSKGKASEAFKSNGMLDDAAHESPNGLTQRHIKALIFAALSTHLQNTFWLNLWMEQDI